jgi:hypothetical protein
MEQAQGSAEKSFLLISKYSFVFAATCAETNMMKMD